MKSKTTIAVFAILAATALLGATATYVIIPADAAIRDVCEKNGRTSEGGCTGNTDKNGKDDVAVNPANKAPPGQN
jgi:hypothetical protein